MGETPRTAVTKLLQDLEQGQKKSAEELLPLVYEELRQLARSRMAHEAPGQTLQATSLVHEAYLRLLGPADCGWNSRGHFFGAAARAMRRILVEQARRKGRLKRGGDRERVALEDAELAWNAPDDNVLAVEDAVQRLEQQDARKGQIVNLRYFAGLSVEETAHAIGLSVGTVEREWRFIKAWLRSQLDAADSGTDPEAREAAGGDPAAQSRPPADDA